MPVKAITDKRFQKVMYDVTFIKILKLCPECEKKVIKAFILESKQYKNLGGVKKNMVINHIYD
jgi:hypothetical protein